MAAMASRVAVAVAALACSRLVAAEDGSTRTPDNKVPGHNLLHIAHAAALVRLPDNETKPIAVTDSNKSPPSCAVFDGCASKGGGLQKCCVDHMASDARVCGVCLRAGCTLRADYCRTNTTEVQSDLYCAVCFHVTRHEKKDFRGRDFRREQVYEDRKVKRKNAAIMKASKSRTWSRRLFDSKLAAKPPQAAEEALKRPAGKAFKKGSPKAFPKKFKPGAAPKAPPTAKGIHAGKLGKSGPGAFNKSVRRAAAAVGLKGGQPAKPAKPYAKPAKPYAKASNMQKNKPPFGMKGGPKLGWTGWGSKNKFKNMKAEI